MAYVENLKPLSGSNFSTAFIRPMLPSWIRSSKQNIAPVLLGNADHQPEVLLDEPLPGPLVAGLGPHAEIYLLGVRQEIALPDVREILGEELGGLDSRSIF